jgi:predicted nucleotidyltransferase
MKTNHPIQKIGSYLPIDGQGYIVNPTSIKKIQPEWLAAVEKVKKAYVQHFGEDLHSIYIRGSVAKGHAIENISDIDSFAVVSLPDEKIDTSWAAAFRDELISEYPFITGVEIGAIPLDEIKDNKGDQIMIKTQAICMYGKNLADEIPAMKPGRETAQHVVYIEKEIVRTKEWLNSEHSAEEIMRKCTWIMKRILRSGFELVMERSQKYTRDLYPCYEGFSEYYPEQKDNMYKVLELAINPTDDKAEIEEVLDSIGNWIIKEVGNSQRHLM